MEQAGMLVRRQRARAGLSVRALADAAGVSASTVSRIESGAADPGTLMLARLMTAAGAELELRVHHVAARPAAADASHPGLRLADLSGAWRSTPGGGARPDWTRLRAFLDDVALHPERAAGAIDEAPPMSRSRLMNALLAGIADKVADDHGLARPSWTAAPGRRLKRTWQAPGTPTMRRRAREAAPQQLLGHNVAVSEDSLWRTTDSGVAS